MTHFSLNTEVAERVGAEAAIIYEFLTLLTQRYNVIKDTDPNAIETLHFSPVGFKRLFTFLTEKEIKSAIETLVSSGYVRIIKDDYYETLV